MRVLKSLDLMCYRAVLHVLCSTARIFDSSYPTAEELDPTSERRRRESAERYQKDLERVAAPKHERSP